MLSRYQSVVFVLAILGGLTGGCCATEPSLDPVEQCMLDCHRVGEACNPDMVQGRFSAENCARDCMLENSRLVRFPDCVPCLRDTAECTGTLFIDRCLDYCWDPENPGDGAGGQMTGM